MAVTALFFLGASSTQAQTPPRANAGEDKVGCVDEAIVFDGRQSIARERDLVFSEWDFGDYTTDHGLKVKHSYHRAGNYDVRLTIENATPFKETPPRSSDSLIVRVNTSPRASLKLPKETYFSGQEIRFNATASYDPDGNALKFLWDFGDGIKIKDSDKPGHIFKEAGQYTGTVFADDNKGTGCSQDSASVQVKVNASPVAEAGDDVRACLNEEVMFDGSHSSHIKEGNVRLRWDFGDGRKAQGISAAHIFRKPGIYTANLKIKRLDVPNIPESLDTRLVKVNINPVAEFTVAQTGQSASFDATSSHDPEGDHLKYSWNFGDGKILKDAPAQIEHIYEKEGTYTVTLLVDDTHTTNCSTHTQTKSITIKSSTLPENK